MESPPKRVKPAPGAAGMLRLLAGAQLVPIGMALVVAFGQVQDRVARALDKNPQPLGEAGASTVVAGATLAGLVGLVAAITLVAVAPKVARGSGAARVVAGVLGAVLALWSGVVAAINPAGGPLTLLAPAADTNNTLSAKQFQDQLNAGLPGWCQPVTLGFAALTAVLVVALFVSLGRSATSTR
jgi:hypothetical protein